MPPPPSPRRLSRLRHSLALRLAGLQTLAFAFGAVVLFGVLYWILAGALEARDKTEIEDRAADLAGAYNAGGIQGLRERLAAENSPELRTVFVRLIDPNGQAAFVTVPAGWVDPQARPVMVPDGWGGWSLGEVHSVRIPRDATRDLAIASRLLSDGRLIQVGRSTDSRAVLLAPLRSAFIRVGAFSLLASIAAGTWLGWRATRSLREVAGTAGSILATGDLGARIPVRETSGELADLVRQLNTLFDRNATHVRVLRETLDNLAHDLRTPLTRLRGTAELALSSDMPDAPLALPAAAAAGAGAAETAKEALSDCVEQSDRVLHLLEALLDVSAAEAGVLPLARIPVDARELALRAADLYSEVAEDRRITVQVEPGPAVPVLADPVRLGQALSNLLDNALKFTPEGGEVRIRADREGAHARLVVSDNGPGIPAAERESVWRRLYRGDASRTHRGLGLGLSLVKAIVLAHGGSATLDEAPGGGARFTLLIPVSAGTPASA